MVVVTVRGLSSGSPGGTIGEIGSMVKRFGSPELKKHIVLLIPNPSVVMNLAKKESSYIEIQAVPGEGSPGDELFALIEKYFPSWDLQMIPVRFRAGKE